MLKWRRDHWFEEWRRVPAKDITSRRSPRAHLDVVEILRVLSLWHKPTELAHSFLFCSYVCFYQYSPFNCISYNKFSRQLSPFSLCSSGLISALLVLSTIYLFVKVSLSPDIILCGWLGLKHQLTNITKVKVYQSRSSESWGDSSKKTAHSRWSSPWPAMTLLTYKSKQESKQHREMLLIFFLCVCVFVVVAFWLSFKFAVIWLSTCTTQVSHNELNQLRKVETKADTCNYNWLFTGHGLALLVKVKYDTKGTKRFMYVRTKPVLSPLLLCCFSFLHGRWE